MLALISEIINFLEYRISLIIKFSSFFPVWKFGLIVVDCTLIARIKPRIYANRKKGGVRWLEWVLCKPPLPDVRSRDRNLFLNRQYECFQTIECRRTTQRRTKQLGQSVAGSLVEIHVPDVTWSVNKTNLIARLVKSACISSVDANRRNER